MGVVIFLTFKKFLRSLIGSRWFFSPPAKLRSVPFARSERYREKTRDIFRVRDSSKKNLVMFLFWTFFKTVIIFIHFLVKAFGWYIHHTPQTFRESNWNPHETNKQSQCVNGRPNGLRKSTTYGASSALQKDLGRFSKTSPRRLFGPETRGFASGFRLRKRAPGNGWYLKFVHHEPLSSPCSLGKKKPQRNWPSHLVAEEEEKTFERFHFQKNMLNLELLN